MKLNSTKFHVEPGNEEIIFWVSGYGHRVGMSQYGAEAMAVQGNAFDQILQYYYSGTELMMYSE